MSQQQKLEQVLDLLLNEESDQAAELLHQIIVEKARVIYENIVEEDDETKDELDESDDVGGEPNKDFTNEISTDKDEIDADEHNAGEAEGEEADGADDDSKMGDMEGEGDVEDRVEDLESQLAELRAEFDQLMGEEMHEPEHADLEGEFDMDDDGVEAAGEMDVEDDMPSFGGAGEEKVVGEVVATMFEKRKDSKLKKAPEMKDKKKDKKVDEETQFLTKVADTGQRGTAKLVGTGNKTPLGAEQDNSGFTHIPPRKDYGGKPFDFGHGTGGEYGKFNAGTGKDMTPSNNTGVAPKKTGSNVDKTEGKFAGTGKGSQTGATGTQSPLSKRPTK